MDLKRNHFMPRFMLARWSSRSADRPYTGVWVYEIEAKKKYFANAQGSGAFSFAIRSDLYVPKVSGQRATAPERWLSSLEGTLATFVRQVDARTEQLRFKTQSEVTKLLMALFALECRSPYNIKMVMAALEKDPHFRELIAGEPADTLQTLALQNLVTYASEHAIRFSPVEMILFGSPEGGVLFCDRPFFNHATLSHRFLALTPSMYVALQKSPASVPLRYQYQALAPEFRDALNQTMATQAREWIVAENASVLDRYIPVIESDQWRKNRDSEQVGVDPVSYLTKGWRMPAESPKK